MDKISGAQNKQNDYKARLEVESLSIYGVVKCYASHRPYKGLIASHMKPYKLCVLEGDEASLFNISAETTLNIYSHITDTMQQQAAVCIDREIGGTDAQMPENQPCGAIDGDGASDTEPEFTPYTGKIRRSGTGCTSMLNDHLYEERFTLTNADGKRISKNVYAKTREECEEKLSELIVRMKAEIAEEKARRKAV